MKGSAVFMIRDEISESVLLWDNLKRSCKPIVMYGMGNAAEKILDHAKSQGIKIDGVFASDEFVRGHYFRGYKVKTFTEICKTYGDFIILVAFATRMKEVTDRIYALDEEYELYAPDVSMFEERNPDCYNAIDELSNNAEHYNRAYTLFTDEKSRQVFRNAINFRISGRIKYIRECETKKREALSLLSLEKIQKFHYIDIGAYDGDTIIELAEYLSDIGTHLGDISKVTAFEPDEKNFSKLVKNLISAGLQDICDLHNTAAWNRLQEIYFSHKAGRHSAVVNNHGNHGEPDEPKKLAKAKKIMADSLDNVLSHGARDTEYLCPHFIKYDVEGCEYEAIEGSAGIIKKYRPAIAASLYHKASDLFRVPLLINRFNASYKFYLRKHEYIPFWDLNLYACSRGEPS